MLSMRQCDVSYGQSLVLREVKLDILPGNITALMGRNGVGKTTTLKTLMGLLKQDRGEILFEGKPIHHLPTYERARLGIAYVPQGREIFPKLTVFENLLLGLEGRRDGVRRVDEETLYQLFPVLGQMKHRMGGNLSGGQQQQLAIARALVSDPKLLILDEPTEGIQPSIILDIENVLIKLKKESRLTILLVEQYLHFTKRVADNIYVMDRGSMVMNGSISELTEATIRKYLTF